MDNNITILDFLQFDCPTNQQKIALLEMSAFIQSENKKDFYILCGAAGTGKTSITTALIGYMNSRLVNYKIVAPTGRAARVIGRKSKTLTSTIHSLIYDAKSKPTTGEIFFELKQNPIKDLSIYIVDEASMVSATLQREEGSLFFSQNALLKDFITFVKSGNSKNKIIFLGDKNQLPPINEVDSMALSEEYLKEKFQLTGNSQLLTEVKRQDDGSHILKNAMAIRDGIKNNAYKVPLQGLEKMNVNNAANAYISEYKKNGWEAVVSIGTTHKMNTMFNKTIRERLYGVNGKTIEKDELILITQTWRRNGIILYSGEHVIVSEVNDSEIEFVAGLHFIAVKLIYKTIEGKSETIEDFLLLESILNPEGLKVEQEKRLRFERFQKNKVYRETGNASDDRYVGAIRASYGYSITCNKAQGGEWNKVFMNTFFVPSLKYQYTAVTRAK
ncbi:MAG: helicase, partial [Pedobacter sp.]